MFRGGLGVGILWAGETIWRIVRVGSVRRVLRMAVPSWPVAPKRAILGISFFLSSFLFLFFSLVL